MSVTEFKRGVPTYKDKDNNEYGLLCETKEVCVTDNNGVNLEYKLQTLMQNVTSLTSELQSCAKASDLANYLPLTGGEINGNVTMKTDDATKALVYELKTPNRTIKIAILGNGNFGILDDTHGEWIIAKDEEGTRTFNGLASKNLPLTGGKLSGEITIETSGSISSALWLKNGARNIVEAVYPNGNFALYDVTYSKDIINSTANGTNTFNGTASGNLPLTGGTVNGSVKANGIESTDGFVHSTKSGKLHLFKFTDSAGEWGSQIRDYKADGSYNALIFQNTNKISWGTFDANNTKTGGGEILHAGNSSKVVISQTAPSDTSALWVW